MTISAFDRVAPRLRWNDYSLSDEQQDLRAVTQQFLERHCTSAVVRAAEPGGFDERLWQLAGDAGISGIGIAEEIDGQGGDLPELAVVAEELGRALAPIPLAEHIVAVRLLHSTGGGGSDLAGAVAGGLVLGLAPLSGRSPWPQLVPGGAAARAVLGLVDGDLVLLRREESPPLAATEANLPLAVWALDADTEVVPLAAGDDARRLWETALGDYRVVTAAGLVGLAAGAVELARGYATERSAFGAIIGSYQAVSHTLVDGVMRIAAARNLTRRAAWYHAHESATRPELPAIALAHAAAAATRWTAAAVHVHGGFGLTLEADVSLYHRRAAARGQAAGGLREHRAAMAPALDRLVAARRSPRSEETR
ncbi:acyl-CoA dehydrogenase family protein [Pseudonocardia ailaonensis]|uniref:Acyl-CoA dehydrogenase family protein n=1 Tax=Pseudonocardia ailaonensis TaxID=367279 RepID=A0ABN2MYV3_9PSEU